LDVAQIQIAPQLMLVSIEIANQFVDQLQDLHVVLALYAMASLIKLFANVKVRNLSGLHSK